MILGENYKPYFFVNVLSKINDNKDNRYFERRNQNMDSRIYSSNMQVAKVFSNIQKKLASNLENISYKSVLEKEIDTFAEKSSEDMTIEEYKAYIWDRIDSFPI